MFKFLYKLTSWFVEINVQGFIKAYSNMKPMRSRLNLLTSNFDCANLNYFIIVIMYHFSLEQNN